MRGIREFLVATRWYLGHTIGVTRSFGQITETQLTFEKMAGLLGLQFPYRNCGSQPGGLAYARRCYHV